jgi:cytochrome c oxidase accessory protein FixG
MGIDIRNGPQLECIHCALCIDACNDIMDKVGRPKWLIGYDTDDNIDRRMKGEQPRYRFIRTRTLVYAVSLVVVLAIMLYALATRSELELNVTRDRNPNYVELSDGSVRNGYTLKVLNKANAPRSLDLSVEGDPAIEMRVLGVEDGDRLTVRRDRTQDFRIFLSLPAGAVDSPSEPITFIVTDPETGETARTRSTLQTGATR